MVSSAVVDDATTILVADDDPAIVELVVKRLEHAGYQTVTAADGVGAIERLEQSDVDLALLDIMMPELNGYQVLQRIRAQHEASDLPVIMMSAKDQGEDVVHALHLGANDYAIKPVDFKTLLQRIEREELIPAGSAEEIEIRACGVHAAELIVERLHSRAPDVRATDLDHLLWMRGSGAGYKARPRHRTRCAFY